jgi:hypothetical protein
VLQYSYDDFISSFFVSVRSLPWDRGKNAFAFAFACSAVHSLTSAATALPFAPRRTYGSHPRLLRHFSGISRSSRGGEVSIQRFLGSVPPVNSAGIMQNLQNLRIKNAVLSNDVLALYLCVSAVQPY